MTFIELEILNPIGLRLESMGALTHGDRHSAAKQQDLSKFNFDTPLGKKALDTVLKSICKYIITKIPKNYHAAVDLAQELFYGL